MNLLPLHTWMWLLANVLIALSAMAIALYTNRTKDHRGDNE